MNRVGANLSSTFSRNVYKMVTVRNGCAPKRNKKRAAVAGGSR